MCKERQRQTELCAVPTVLPLDTYYRGIIPICLHYRRFPDLNFALLVDLVLRYVSTQLEVSPVFLFRENWRHGTDRRTDRQTGATLSRYMIGITYASQILLYLPTRSTAPANARYTFAIAGVLVHVASKTFKMNQCLQSSDSDYKTHFSPDTNCRVIASCC